MTSNSHNELNDELIARYLSKEATPDEIKLIESSMNSADGANLLLATKQVWDESQLALIHRSINSMSAFEKVKCQIDKSETKKVRFNHVPWMSIAASLILVLSAVWYLSNQSKSIQPNSLVKMSYQLPETIQLADGSQVDINSGSTLSYPSEFVGGERRVALNGEAFFSVSKVPGKKFTVETLSLEVHVLGTEFNVKAYQADQMFEVVVDLGIVEVANSGHHVKLLAGDKALVNRETGEIVKMLNNDVNYIAWKTKEIEFDDVQMDEVIKVLENVYKINIHVTNPSIYDSRITAGFKDQSLEFVLQVICKTFNLNYALTGNKCTLTNN